MNSNPLWYKLIKLLKSNGTIGTGLTFPYIYGAYELLGEPFESIKEILEHLLNNPIDKFPVIQKCNVIQQHVVMVEKKEICNKGYYNDVKFDNVKKDNKLFVSTNTDLGKTLDKVSSNLVAQYQNPIDRKHYSWDNKMKAWKVFTNEEIQMILSINESMK